MTRDEIEAAAKPLDALTAALNTAVSKVRLGQPHTFDPEAAVATVDQMAAFVGRQFTVDTWRGAAGKANRAHAVLYRLLSGDTSLQPVDLLIELAALRAILEQLPSGERPAAAA